MTLVPANWEYKAHYWVRRLFRLRSKLWLVVLIVSIGYLAWQRHKSSFVMIRADQGVSGPSAYPVAVSPERVGSYPPDTKSGAGYFYDDVLEYRVWLSPERGAESLNGNGDYFVAFAQYEKAKQFSDVTKGAEQPIALVLQREWIDEPEPGKFIPEKEEQITEWRVKWLSAGHRAPNSIEEFMKHPRKATVETDDD
jgi:hypothetical protein